MNGKQKRAQSSSISQGVRLALGKLRTAGISMRMKELKQQENLEIDNIPGGEKFMIVGLGNPGRQYQHNRHNIGFMAIDRLAKAHSIQMTRVQNRAIVGDGRVAERKVILAKPQTFMNLSGDSVGPLAGFFRIPPGNMLVIYDELDLPLGTIRLREQGGAGGHNGMKSIIHHLGNGFPRIRLGIGRPEGRMSPAAYVLQDFGKKDSEVVQAIIEATLEAVETYLRSGIDLAMTRHNMSRLGDAPEK